MLLGLLLRKNIKKLSDSELLKLVSKKNQLAIGELFERYSFLVMGVCLKYLKSVPEAEDMMMNIYEKLPQKVSVSEINNFKSWLHSVCRNECLMDLRKKKLDTSEIESALIYTADESETEIKLSEMKELELKKLESAVNQLKDEQKKCITHFYLEQKSYDEIVKLTGYDLKKVKSYIQNGKRNLKLLIEKTK
jgi:RNA polymerase sigma-70 factor (ECF subfamily)